MSGHWCLVATLRINVIVNRAKPKEEMRGDDHTVIIQASAESTLVIREASIDPTEDHQGFDRLAWEAKDRVLPDHCFSPTSSQTLTLSFSSAVTSILIDTLLTGRLFAQSI